ncbi:MAG TPA: DUF86 domain-containing protein [Thermomicrobiales bacterium]|nr:DUF86 domain-containing protein [Thermomicrobiales bacterium]
MTLEDIVEACNKVIVYADQLTFDDFTRHDMGYDAIVRRIAVIGEAAARLPVAFREQHPTVPWRQIINLRNIVVHQYSGIDDGIIWEVASTRIPALHEQVLRMLHGEAAGGGHEQR